ncbi:MAG: ATP synthase F0 subunit C [Candidatus Gracilibacteria bacterium]
MDAEMMKMLAAALAVAVGVTGPALGEGWIAAKTMESVSRNPEMSGKMFTNMLIGMAFVESLGVYCFLVALIILFVM